MTTYHLPDFPPDWPAKVLGVMTAEGAVDWSDAEIDRCTSRCSSQRIGDCARAMRDADRAAQSYTVHTIAADGTEADVTIVAASKAEAVAIAHERQYADHGLRGVGAYYAPRPVDPAAGSGAFLLDAMNPPWGAS